MDAPSKVSGCRPIIRCVLFGVKHVDSRVLRGMEEGANTKTTGLGSCDAWPRRIGLAFGTSRRCQNEEGRLQSPIQRQSKATCSKAHTHRTSTVSTNNSMYNRPTNCSG